jgi:hypothetical protein
MMELQVQVLFCLSSSDARDKEGGTLVFQAHYYDTPLELSALWFQGPSSLPSV